MSCFFFWNLYWNSSLVYHGAFTVLKSTLKHQAGSWHQVLWPFWGDSVLKDYFWIINEYIEGTAHTTIISYNFLKFFNVFTNDNIRIKISKMLYAFMVRQKILESKSRKIKNCSSWRWKICKKKILKYYLMNIGTN